MDRISEKAQDLFKEGLFDSCLFIVCQFDKDWFVGERFQSKRNESDNAR
jgi:hypothetical protein